jgi:hypothetical protein
MPRGVNSSLKVQYSNSISRAHVFLWGSECEYAEKLILLNLILS